MPSETAPNKVLFVDDSWYMRAVVRDALEEYGYEVICGSDGADALELYKGTMPHLVLMDMVLPDMDGLEAISQIRGVDPSARVMIVTGLTDEGVRRRATQAGVNGFVQKPFTASELLSAVSAEFTDEWAQACQLQVAG
jgi:two-component system chemotaxis response regulator CheY